RAGADQGALRRRGVTALPPVDGGGVGPLHPGVLRPGAGSAERRRRDGAVDGRAVPGRATAPLPARDAQVRLPLRRGGRAPLGRIAAVPGLEGAPGHADTAPRAIEAAPAPWAAQGVFGLADLLVARVQDDDGVARIAAGAPLNTDQLNLLQVRSPLILG